MFDRDGVDETLEQITTLIRNLGVADIPILGYQWNPQGVVPMRTGTAELRGGAEGTAFDYDEVDDPDELGPASSASIPKWSFRSTTSRSSRRWCRSPTRRRTRDGRLLCSRGVCQIRSRRASPEHCPVESGVASAVSAFAARFFSVRSKSIAMACSLSLPR
nr:hypothetical protein [Haloterrigena salina]